MAARNAIDVKSAGRTCERCLLHARLYAALGLALADFVAQELKRKIAKELIRRWLD